MRPPRLQRSRQEYPLDVVLGAPAHVRLLRVLLHDFDGPVSVTDAARGAGLTTAGARKALEVLSGMSVVERVGSGRALKYGPRAEAPFNGELRRLFDREDERYHQLLRALRDGVSIPEVTSAWLHESATNGERGVVIDVVVDTKAFGWIGPELRSRLNPTESDFDTIIEVNAFTRADRFEPPTDATLIWGVGARKGAAQSTGVRSRDESAERSYRMARMIAQMLRSDPSLVRRALRHTMLLLDEGQGTAQGDLEEWRQLLETYSPQRLAELLVSRSSRADRLRRSSPFVAVLTADERDRVIKGTESGG